MRDGRLPAARTELPNVVLQGQIRVGEPFVLAQVLLPGAHVEALDETIGIGEIALEHPVHRPVAEAELPQLLHPRTEGRRIGGDYPVRERDPHRPGWDHGADARLGPEVGGAAICPSSVDQLEQNVAALDNLSLSADELAEIDRHLAADGSVDVWRQAREGAL
jgi:hypothetical protein